MRKGSGNSHRPGESVSRAKGQYSQRQRTIEQPLGDLVDRSISPRGNDPIISFFAGGSGKVDSFSRVLGVSQVPSPAGTQDLSDHGLKIDIPGSRPGIGDKEVAIPHAQATSTPNRS